MRYVVSGRLREASGLSPAEYFALAVREWEIVLDWLHSGKALGYGRVGGTGGAILVDAVSTAEAQALARSLPFAPYAEMWVTPARGVETPGRRLTALLGQDGRAGPGPG